MSLVGDEARLALGWHIDDGSFRDEAAVVGVGIGLGNDASCRSTISAEHDFRADISVKHLQHQQRQ